MSSVIGIELCPEAIENAKRNAHINGTCKINFKQNYSQRLSVNRFKDLFIVLVHKYQLTEITEIVLIVLLLMS